VQLDLLDLRRHGQATATCCARRSARLRGATGRMPE
jgi:hypothetical protein